MLLPPPLLRLPPRKAWGLQLQGQAQAQAQAQVQGQVQAQAQAQAQAQGQGQGQAQGQGQVPVPPTPRWALVSGMFLLSPSPVPRSRQTSGAVSPCRFWMATTTKPLR